MAQNRRALVFSYVALAEQARQASLRLRLHTFWPARRV